MAKDLTDVLVSVRNMEVTFGSKRHPFVAVHDVSFDIYKGETFGLVGESGSGKTTIGRAIIRINPMSAGEVFFNGERISGKISKELDKQVTQNIQMIFQDPMASLNERAKVDYIVSEGLQNVRKDLSKEERSKMVEQALLDVGLLPEFASRFPHEFSGGQRQRICIARALALNPKVIIADESVSALDVSIRGQIINLMLDLQRELGIAYLFISHDMAVVERISHRVAVMYLGQIVEIGTRRAVFENPQHPYTRKLMAAVPVADPSHHRPQRVLLSDDIPSNIRKRGEEISPVSLQLVGPGHYVARPLPENALSRL